MNVSKNHDVCPRCHLVGLTSGIDWTVWSSGDSGAARASVVARTSSIGAGELVASGVGVSVGHRHHHFESAPVRGRGGGYGEVLATPYCRGDRVHAAG